VRRHSPKKDYVRGCMPGGPWVQAALARNRAGRRDAKEFKLSCILPKPTLSSAASIESLLTNEGCLSAAWSGFCALELLTELVKIFSKSPVDTIGAGE